MKRKIIMVILTLVLVLALVPPVFAQLIDEEEDTSTFCLDLESDLRHPVGVKLADAYDEDYETVMGWFCEEEFGFGEIMHALKTSAAIEGEKSPEELLDRKTELGGWGLVWQELGLIGHSDEADTLDEVDTEEEEDVSNFCGDLSSEERHPTGEKLAAEYEVEYEELMGWFCEENFGFGEIKHALKTSALAEVEDTPEELLAMKTDLGGWGQVWQSLGLIGHSKGDLEDSSGTEEVGKTKVKVNEGKRPEHAGPPANKGRP